VVVKDSSSPGHMSRHMNVIMFSLCCAGYTSQWSRAVSNALGPITRIKLA
jgi:hypothetical protein